MASTKLKQITRRLSSELQEGDLIFIAIDSFLYRQVAQGTGSWTSHVGCVVKEDGEWVVLESAVPVVTRCPLEKFVSRSRNYQVTVKRLAKSLSTTQVSAIKAHADKYMGRFYHLGFNFDSRHQFCSKFVHLIYKEATGLSLGKLQTLEDLIQENPQANLTFWRFWYLGRIPWQRNTITPASQLNDPQLLTVVSLDGSEQLH